MNVDFEAIHQNVESTIKKAEPNADGLFGADSILESVERLSLKITIKCLKEYHEQLQATLLNNQ